MKKPPVLQPGDDSHQVLKLFDAPLVVKGATWLPVTQPVVWAALAYWKKQSKPGLSWPAAIGFGGLAMPIVLGSEWCHNLAHAATASWTGKPVDAIRITWGMPLLVYYDPDDMDVTPLEHVSRALGGPLFNAILLSTALLLRMRTRAGTLMRDLSEVALWTNAFLSTVSLFPIPFIDGGPILKWSLVAQGRSPEQADGVVLKANGVLGCLLSCASVFVLMRGKRLLGSLLAMLGLTALAVALGWLEEA